MKRILYLDKDYIESFLAQSQGGLPGQHTFASASGTAESQSLTDPSVNQKVTGEVGASVLVAKGGASYEREALSEVRQSKSTNLDAASETIIVLPHDNALDEVIHTSKALLNTGRNIGDFIVVENGKPLIYDIKDITDRMDDKAITFMANRMWTEHLAKLSNPLAKEVQKGKNSFISGKMGELKESREALEMACKFAQFDVCIVIDDVLAPMKREWMRSTSRDMIFKYNSRLKIFGQVTRISEGVNKKPPTNPVEQLNDIFNGAWPDALQKMQIIPKNRYLVVDPMAIYFE